MADFSIPDSVRTVGTLVEWASGRLQQANVFFGHGTDNAFDEAAAIVFHVSGLSHADGDSVYDKRLDADLLATVQKLLTERIQRRVPVPYLLNEAWFAGLPFYIDQRALIPRSPLAELILSGFDPWLDAGRPGSGLELGTGSGCIAVACAMALPDWSLLATDVSAAALEVAKINVDRYQLSNRVRLQQADLFAGIEGSFDLIISNPPYVPDADRQHLPAEYAHEPSLALFSGADGLDSARRILQDARNYLTNKGILVLEVGEQWQALEAAFPRLPFTWLEFERAGTGVALITAHELDPAGD